MEFKRFDARESLPVAFDNGINLFLGAGFSVEAFDAEDRKLPIGKDLLNELKQKFDKVKNFSSLSMVSTVLEATIKEEFNAYLDNRFKVKSYDELYNSLLKLNIKNIYTTNIDDLMFSIFK